MRNRPPQKILHPRRFIWDFWHLWDEEQKLFHIFFLNAPKPSIRGERYHHLARVGYAISPDFRRVEWIEDDMFLSDPYGWDNASIWSGDTIKTGGGWLMGYTSRDLRAEDKFVQTIGFAFSANLRRWERLPELTLPPHPEWYETAAAEGDDTIPAWRDPYFIASENGLEILFFAKSKSLPAGKKACVGHARLNGSRDGWEVLPPLLAPGVYSEMDVPQLLHVEGNKYQLLFSIGVECDKSPVTRGTGGAQSLPVERDARTGELRVTGEPVVYVPASRKLYAFRAITELGGELIGFDVESGGWVNSGAHIPCSPVQSKNSTLPWPGRR